MKSDTERWAETYPKYDLKNPTGLVEILLSINQKYFHGKILMLN